MNHSHHGAPPVHLRGPGRHRSPVQRLNLLAAVLLGVAPIIFGLLQAGTSGADFGTFWMALAATFFAGGVLAAAIGRRRSRRAVRVQAIVIFMVSTVLAAGAAFVFDAPNAWVVAVTFGLCLGTASVLFGLARPGA